MFCPNCAQPVKDGSKFCEYCGFPLASIQMPTQTAVAAEPVAPVEESPVVPVQEEAPVQPEVVQPTQPQPAVTYQQPVQTQPTATYGQPAQTQSTAAYPQPVQQQAYAYQQPVQPQQQATYQQPVYQQQAPYQQAGVPQAPTYAQSYAQLDIPQTPAKDSVTSKLWFKILIGLIAALVLFGIAKAVSNAISRALVNGSNSPAQSENTVVIDDGGDVFDIIDNIVNSTNPTDILDPNNNPTAYAILNMDGESLTNSLAEVDWSFDSDMLLWCSDDNNNAYYVYGEDEYEFTKSDIDDMAPNGGNDVAIMVALLDDYDYDSLDDVESKIINVIVQDIYDDEDVRFYILQTETGEYDFAVLYHDEYSGLYRLEIANEAAVKSGAASDFFGLYGETIDDIWYDATGRSIAKG